MSERRPQIPPRDDDVTTSVRFRALMRRLSADPDRPCGLCRQTFLAGQSVILFFCGHIMHSGCIERQREKQRCPYCNQPIVTQNIIPNPQARSGPPPSALSGSHAAPAA